jgi:hypothetical protein
MGIPVDYADLVREAEEARDCLRAMVAEMREEGTCRTPEASRGS